MYDQKLVTSGKIPGGLTPEEKLARKVAKDVGHIGFNLHLFAQSLAVEGGDAMEARNLALVKAILKYYADMHDAGFKTKHTREAKRIHG